MSKTEPSRTALSRLEQALYRSTWDDGLLDVWAGVGIAGTGALWLAGWMWVGPSVPLLLLVGWPAARRRWVEPRAGTMRLQRERQGRERLKLVWCLQVGWPVLVLVLLGCWGIAVGRWLPPRSLAPAIPLVILAALAFGASWLLSLPRFSAYAALLLLVGTAGVALACEPGALMVAGGGLITGAGLLRFARFLRRRPVAGAGNG